MQNQNQNPGGIDADRYYPTDEELKILIPMLRKYFSLPERSNSRKDLVDEVFTAVAKINPKHWDAKKVRIWFRNNKKTFMSADPERIPTAQIPPIPTGDPNMIQSNDSNEMRGIQRPRFVNPNAPVQNRSNQAPQQAFVPDLPIIKQEITTDQSSFQTSLEEHYEYLDKLRGLLIQASEHPHAAKINNQKDVSYNYTQCLQQMSKKLNVENIFSYDSRAKKVYALPAKHLISKISLTSALAATQGQYPLKTECKMAKLTDNVYRKEGMETPVGLSSEYLKFYSGNLTETIKDIPGLSSSTFTSDGKLIYSYFDPDKKQHLLKFEENTVTIPCFQPPTSMVYDEELKIVWISAECRIFGISTETLSVVDILFASVQPSDTTSISIADDNLVLTINNVIIIYKRQKSQGPSLAIMSDLNTSLLEDKIRPASLDRNSISWKRGRQNFSTLAPSCRNYSYTSYINKNFIISSSISPSMDIMTIERQSLGNLIGHTAGITSMTTCKDILFTGSADCTVKAWDIKHSSVLYHFDRHSAKVTALFACEVDGRLVVFSGGDDGVIIVWDPVNSTEIFEFYREKTTIRRVHFVPEQMTLYAVIRDDSEIILPKTQILTVKIE
ncbi:hypothetical protein TVAG_165150 [Trichomonas vaginalis G3]|uniref:Uncharacterized protein n=1 Tax=Trichomonas vaginalis (strain ATCC PRA-98 / G3) TaxID=412133 RepID=A2DUJ6_TRIV3|nr:transcription initiation from RNA polymerase II promoter [Trichomonas vaginalis G3]EAY15887.1 hypothetical protein TVAG_165150 [Trichomonas vaginalis G3]KAI5506652.1 transcription initiation from RNA polymerase II promoter [Trichomonas vaginalis G3]|eukprot:XP_001328110.1 hypothetical protein [Trichomonas vaginalis G3]